MNRAVIPLAAAANASVETARPAAAEAKRPSHRPRASRRRRAAAPALRPGPRAVRRAVSVYYSGCNEVRAAGLAPLYRGDPGYRPEMDGDADGIACEPHRGRG